MVKIRAFLAILFLSLLSIGGVQAAGGRPFQLSKKQVLENLDELALQNRKRLEQVDRKLQETVAEVSKNPISQGGDQLQAAEATIESLITERTEHLLRQDFIDRLKFQVDSRYQGGDLKEFLSTTLKSMTLVEAKSMSSSKELLLFLTYLSVAIQNIPEHYADPIAFIEGYMKESTIRRPIRPDQYLKQDHYSNGTVTVTAKPANAEEIGEMVEAKLNQLELEAAHRQSQKTFELRRPLLKGVQQKIEEKSLVPESVNPEAQ